MVKRLSMHRREHQARSKWHPLFAGFAAALAVASGFIFFDFTEDANLKVRQRLYVSEYLAHSNDTVKSVFSIHLGALDAFDGLVKAQANLNQDVFKSVATALVQRHPTIRQIQLSPNAVIEYLHPTHAKDKALGLDLRSLPGQKDDVEKSIKDGLIKTVGPITLAQGGKAIITRKPIYTGNGAGRRFWGFVTILLDYPKLVEMLHASLKSRRLDVALKVGDNNGRRGKFVFGNKALFLPNQALSVNVDIPGTRWVLAVAPRNGWSAERPERWLLIALGFCVSAFCGVLVYWDTKRRYSVKLTATTDSLTGISSRHAFESLGRAEFSKARRHGFSLGLILMDLDHFKSVNDEFGHGAGDKVLTAVSALISGRLRDGDLFGRLGGEEFGILVPHSAGRNVFTVAERLRMRIESLEVDLGHTKISLTASFGIADLDESTTDITALIEKADRALYDAKNSGRNKVCGQINMTSSPERHEEHELHEHVLGTNVAIV